MKKATLWTMMMLITFTLVTSVHANTLNRRLIAINGGIIQLGGDLDDAISDSIDTIYTYGASVQLPLGEYFALLGGIQRTTTSLNVDDLDGDITGLGFTGGLRLQIPIRDIPITPFVSAQYDYTVTEFELRSGSERIKPELTTGSIGLAVGAEWSITDRFSILGSFSRVSEQTSELKFEGEKIDLADEMGTDNTNVILGALHFWMTDNLLLSGLAAYDTEEETKTYQIALGLSF